MQPLQLAISTAPFRLPLRESLNLAAEMQATGLQLDALNELRAESLSETGRRQFQLSLQERNLRLTSLHLPLQRSLYDQTDLDRRLELIRRTMEFAWLMQAPLLTLRVGHIPTEEDSVERGLLVDVLTDLARYSTRIGTQLAITPSRDKAATLYELVSSIQAGYVGIDFDPAGFYLTGETPEQALQVAYRNVVHVQGRDAVRDIDGGGAEVSIGKGGVNWREFVAQLVEIPYRGWMTVTRTQGDRRIADTESGLTFLRQIGYT